MADDFISPRANRYKKQMTSTVQKPKVETTTHKAEKQIDFTAGVDEDET